MENNKDREYKQRLAEIQQQRNKKRKNPFLRRLRFTGERAYRFVTSDMWRLYDTEMSGVSGFFVRVLRVLYVSVREFVANNVSQKASALTYTTVLALVPMLTIILSIAAGFGLQASVQRALYEAFPAHQMELTISFDFVESYLHQIQSGVLIVIGLAILIWSVFSMLMTVEGVFNEIWQIKKGRPLSKRIVGYLAAFIIVPLSLIVMSFSNIFISSLSSFEILGTISIAPVITTILKILPFVIIVIVLIVVYMTMPNTKVRFLPALIAAIVAGVAFQIFQMLYISGQLWVTRYNSIYGSLAAIPLLMLFIQLSWTIILFGAQFSYAIQNVKRYVFKSESEKISRRFRDLVAVLLMKKICKAFRHQGVPYSAEMLAVETDLPIVIVQDTLDKLVLSRLAIEQPPVKSGQSPLFLPATEITSITVKRILTAMDRLGSENFRVDIYEEYSEEWEMIRLSRSLPHSELDTPVVDL